MKSDPFQVLNLVAQTLFDKKGFNILVLDVRGISTLTDFFVIAEGSVDRHVIALGRAVVDRLQEEGDKPAHTEGLKEGDWVVLDYMEIVIHLFMPGLRDRYCLEELWQEGKVVDVEISMNPKSAVSRGS